MKNHLIYFYSSTDFYNSPNQIIGLDGSGYDLKLIEEISRAVSIPVVACGGAGSFSDLRSVVSCGASAAAAGSMFVFSGKHKAVMISFPSFI